MKILHALQGICLFLGFLLPVSAQDKPGFNFGSLKPLDFTIKIPDFDHAAHAVILGDIGFSSIQPNKDGGFGYKFVRKLRVMILDQNGIDAGVFSIPLYSSRKDDSRETLDAISGVSYNLEGEKIVATKLENSQVFTEKQDRYYQEKKFTLPALKKGTIFELSYTVVSDFLVELRPWNFQSRYPCLWSEYKVEIPQYFDYVYLSTGNPKFHIKTSDSEIRNFLIRQKSSIQQLDETFTVTAMVNKYRWVIKDMPGLQYEDFVTTVENYRIGISFQLSSINYPGSDPMPYMESWAKLTARMMDHERFGALLKADNYWLDPSLDELVKKEMSDMQKARNVYAWVRDNFTCTSVSGVYAEKDLKTVLKTRSGSAAEINLLLMAMLERMQLIYFPVLASTREHGFISETYPIFERFNYVFCDVILDGKSYFLDASMPELAFGRLPLRCYNEQARILKQEPEMVRLSADSIAEKSTTIVLISPDTHRLKASIIMKPGYYETLQKRESFRKNGKDAFENEIRSWHSNEDKISLVQVDSLQQLDQSIQIRYELYTKDLDEGLVYFNPVLFPFFKENPFNAGKRICPVEMPYAADETLIVNLILPADYRVEEIPKSAKVLLNEDDGFFEYLISQTEQVIQLKTRLVFRRANFTPESYGNLRDFMSYVLKKQAEQIVLRKKSSS